MTEPDFLRLDVVDAFVPEMRRRGVSEVARSPVGFLTAYRHARGEPEALSAYWRRRRAAFIARHMAQVRLRKEPLVKKGKLTRRHLALIAWAYTPQPETVRAYFTGGA